MTAEVLDGRRGHPPLWRHVVVRNADEERAAYESNLLMTPHVLEPRTSEMFGWTLHAAKIGQSIVIYHSYRSALDVVTSTPTNDFVLHVVLRGGVELRSDLGGVEMMTPGAACVVSPTERLRMRFAPGTHQLLVRFPIPILEQEFGRLTGEAGGGDIVFRLGACDRVAWLSALHLVVTTIDSVDSGMDVPPRLGEEFERLLISSLLLSQPHSATKELTRPAQSRGTRAVTMIAERIRSTPEQVVDFPGLAGEYGVGLRTVQEGFQLRYGRTPSAFLREARLDMAHRILSGDSATSVTEAALTSGLTHLGRFSRDYRLRFGVSPSTTRDGKARARAPDRSTPTGQWPSGSAPSADAATPPAWTNQRRRHDSEI